MNAAAHTLLPARADAAASADRRIERPLPAGLGACALIHGFLDPTECAALIEAAEARGFAGAGGDYPPSYRNNDRQVLDDAALAQRLFERLRGYAPAELTDVDGARWRLDSLNERLRLCRYRPGQRFNLHQDGVHHRGPDLRSRLTFMIYLTDGAAFAGGDTLFYAHGPGPGGDADGEPLARVRPRAGALIVFDHALWHAGEAVTAGIKHLLRSDLMYRRIDAGGGEPAPATSAAADAAPFAPGHDGYVWTLARLRDGRIASAGRDAQVRLWSGDGRERARLRGHTQSVLGLCELPGARLATVSRDRSLRIWHLDDGRCLRSEIAHDSAALCVTRLGDGRLASGAADGAIALWRDDGERLRTWQAHAGWVWSLCALGPRQLLSASEDGALAWWDPDRGERIAALDRGVPLRSVDAHGACIAFAGIDGRIGLAHAADGALRELRGWTGHEAAVRRVRWLDGGRLVSCGEDGRVRVWDRDGALLQERRHDNFATDALALDDGRLLSCGYDGVLRTG